MRQQLGALKELEELLDLDGKQEANHDISKESIALLANHVDHLKKVCNAAVALAQHYQPAAKDKVKSATVVEDAEDSDGEDETTEEPKEQPAKKTRVKKATAPKAEIEPAPEPMTSTEDKYYEALLKTENDDYDDLLD